MTMEENKIYTIEASQETLDEWKNMHLPWEIEQHKMDIKFIDEEPLKSLEENFAEDFNTWSTEHNMNVHIIDGEMYLKVIDPIYIESVINNFKTNSTKKTLRILGTEEIDTEKELEKEIKDELQLEIDFNNPK